MLDVNFFSFLFLFLFLFFFFLFFFLFFFSCLRFVLYGGTVCLSLINLLELWVFKWVIFGVIFELCLDSEKFLFGLGEKFDGMTFLNFLNFFANFLGMLPLRSGETVSRTKFFFFISFSSLLDPVWHEMKAKICF